MLLLAEIQLPIQKHGVTFRCTISLKSSTELTGIGTSCVPEYLGLGKGLLRTCLHGLKKDELSSNHPYHAYSKRKRNTGNTVYHGEEEYSWKTVKKTMEQQHRILAAMCVIS